MRRETHVRRAKKPRSTTIRQSFDPIALTWYYDVTVLQASGPLAVLNKFFTFKDYSRNCIQASFYQWVAILRHCLDQNGLGSDPGAPKNGLYWTSHFGMASFNSAPPTGPEVSATRATNLAPLIFFKASSVSASGIPASPLGMILVLFGCVQASS